MKRAEGRASLGDRHADVAQLVEHHLAKVGVAGSNPVVRSKKPQVKTVIMADTPKVKGSLRSSRAHRLAFRVLANYFSSRRARSKR